eukprot:Gb_16175 [translate_table: standard]
MEDLVDYSEDPLEGARIWSSPVSKYDLVTSGLEESGGVSDHGQKVCGVLYSIASGGRYSDPKGSSFGSVSSIITETNSVYSASNFLSGVVSGATVSSNLSREGGDFPILSVTGVGVPNEGSGKKFKIHKNCAKQRSTPVNLVLGEEVKMHNGEVSRDGTSRPFSRTSGGGEGGWLAFVFRTASNALKVLKGSWSWHSSNLLLKSWSSFFYARKERLDLVLVWVKLPKLPIDFWTLEVFKEIGNALGSFVEADMSFQDTSAMRVARILVPYLWVFSCKMSTNFQKEGLGEEVTIVTIVEKATTAEEGFPGTVEEVRLEAKRSMEGFKGAPLASKAMEYFSLSKALGGDIVPSIRLQKFPARMLAEESGMDNRCPIAGGDASSPLRNPVNPRGVPIKNLVPLSFTFSPAKDLGSRSWSRMGEGLSFGKGRGSFLESFTGGDLYLHSPHLNAPNLPIVREGEGLVSVEKDSSSPYLGTSSDMEEKAIIYNLRSRGAISGVLGGLGWNEGKGPKYLGSGRKSYLPLAQARATSEVAAGLTRTPKKLALRRIVDTLKSDILLLQDTLCVGGKVVDDLTKMFGGGSLCLWMLGVELYSQELGRELLLLNIYGPYSDRISFWESLLNKDFMRRENLIWGGDLNFSLGNLEIWDPNAQGVYIPAICNLPKKLKQTTLGWAHAKKIKEAKELLEVESKLEVLYESEGDGYLLEETKAEVTALEQRKRKLLAEKEATWRLKSRALWLSKGDLARARVGHFGKNYKGEERFFIAEVVRLTSFFPSFVNEAENLSLTKEASKEERDLLKVVEESRVHGKVLASFNATFIALIPKGDNPSSFEEYKPISFYNCIYKIVSKGTQIHEAIGVAQEDLHSIKTRRLKVMVAKIDLSKAYDGVKWLYLRMMLIHIGLCVPFVNWVMSYVSTVSFFILINGEALEFFRTRRDMQKLKVILELFYVATGMLVNVRKSTTSFIGVEAEDLDYIANLFPFTQGEKGFPWVKWQDLAIPKSLGGWGLRKIFFTFQRLWQRKVFGGFYKGKVCGARIGLVWKVGNGILVRLGEDPWVGSGEDFKLLGHMIQGLRDKGLFKLSQIADPTRTLVKSQGWISASSINFRGEDAQTWGIFVDRLKPSHKRNIVGPSRYPLCKTSEETNNHLIMDCSFFIQVWREIEHLSRNASIFEDRETLPFQCAVQGLSILKSFPQVK